MSGMYLVDTDVQGAHCLKLLDCFNSPEVCIIHHSNWRPTFSTNFSELVLVIPLVGCARPGRGSDLMLVPVGIEGVGRQP